MPTINNIDLLSCLPNCNSGVLETLPSCLKDLKTIKNGLNDLYFIPCSYELNDTDIMDLAWWADVNDTSKPASEQMRRIGRMTGSIQKAEIQKAFVGGCNGEEATSITWELTISVKAMDKESGDWKTHNMADLLLSGALNNYNLAVRRCDPADSIILIGKGTLNDFDNIISNNPKEFEDLQFKIQWTPRNLSTLQNFTIPGLSTIVPASI
jgi:hypothetical protein